MDRTLPRLALLAVASLVLACGGTPTPSGTSAAASAVAPGAGSTPLPPTPFPTSLAGVEAVGMKLPPDTAALDVVYAFGSVWVSAHHQNAVYRIDPVSLQEIARIKVNSGPGSILVTADSLWVSSQLGRGLSRIDPATNTESARAGMWPTCNDPIEALGAIWQVACDAHQLMRIDPATNDATDRTITGYEGVAFVNGELILTGSNGMARIDPETDAITPFDSAAGWLLGFDAQTLLINDRDVQALRVNPATGAETPIAVTYPGRIRFVGDHAWIIQQSTGIAELDASTGAVRRTIPVRSEPSGMWEGGGYLWATSYGAEMLWRIGL